jgi:hypothetical protein
MVKRTLLVLSILSLMVFAAGTSNAFWTGGWGAADECVQKPLFVPVDCPPFPEAKTIIKTWSVKIEGPCPAPGPIACGPAKKDGWGPGMLCAMAGVIATPFDFLFGGCDGVYGCFPGMGGGADGDCGPCFGPIPRVLATVPMVLGAPTVMFGALW